MDPYKSPYPAQPVDAHSPAAIPFPVGWFCVGFSGEWRPGSVRTRRLMDGDIVVYRTRSGVLRVVRPYCPHLGAHLGAGGTVDGELLVCPFHRFAFSPDGTCVRTPYGKPPKATLGLLPTREKYGMVWVWGSPGGAPSWELPEFPSFTRPTAFSATHFAGHAQEVLENFIDYGHVTELHRLAFMHVVREPEGEGHRYSMTYRFGRNLLFFRPSQEATFHFIGLGGVLVLFHVAQLRIRAAQWLLVTPTGPGRLCLRTAARVVTEPVVPGGGVAVRRLVDHVLSSGMNRWTRHDVGADLPIWNHKTYLPHPRLNDGDGPIGAYRHWARQFYPE